MNNGDVWTVLVPEKPGTWDDLITDEEIIEISDDPPYRVHIFGWLVGAIYRHEEFGSGLP